MADYDSSLPVRTETDGDIVAKIVDSAGTNQWTIDANGIGQVNLSDGTNSLTINAGGSLNTIITDGTNNLVVDANGLIGVKVTDGTNTLAPNADGSINVNIVTALSGGEVHKYGTVASLAPATPTTVATHTVTALKTLQLKCVEAASSGKFKAEVKVGANTVAVFFGSTAEGFGEVHFDQPIEVAAGTTVIVEMTNRDKQNADAYAFINGVEV